MYAVYIMHYVYISGRGALLGCPRMVEKIYKKCRREQLFIIKINIPAFSYTIDNLYSYIPSLTITFQAPIKILNFPLAVLSVLSR